jgi:hypothetical protein
MITDYESILSIGQPWPPESELARLARYDQNEKLFDGEHSKVFKVLLNLFSEHTAEYNKIISIFNFHKRLSTLWADLLYGEQPIATASDDPESPEQKYLSDLIQRTQYWKLVHARQIDVSRFGHGIIEAYFDGGCKLQVVHPSKYFAIGDENGRVTGHMIAWTSAEKKRLFCRIHTAGQIESREYAISAAGRIESGPENVQIQETGIDEPLVSVIENVTTSSGKLIDDYSDLDTIIKRIEARLTRVGRILDVHSEPLLVLPEDSGAFTRTETGAVVYDSKKRVIEAVQNASNPQYITWEGQLAAAFSEIEVLMKQLYIVSETCEACFEPTKLGAQISGTALRLMLFVPLKKVDRLKLFSDPIIRRELQTFSNFELARGHANSVPIEKVSIQWQDGLPEDFRETVQNVVMLQAQGLIWPEMALKMLFKLEGTALQEAVEKLQGGSTTATEAPRIELPPIEEA